MVGDYIEYFCHDFIYLMKRLQEIIMMEHSRSHADILANIIIQNPHLIDDLVEIIFSYSEPLSRRAVWPLRIINDKNRILVQPYLTRIIDELPGISCVSVQRVLLAILASSQIPLSRQSNLLQITSDLMLNSGTPVASLIFSMEIYYKIASEEPELLNELVLMIERLSPDASPGVRSKGRKILNRIKTSRAESVYYNVHY